MPTPWIERLLRTLRGLWTGDAADHARFMRRVQLVERHHARAEGLVAQAERRADEVEARLRLLDIQATPRGGGEPR